MTREFPSLDCQVVPARLGRVYAQQSACQKYHVGLPFYVKKAVLRDEREVQVAHVMIDRAAPGYPARKVYAVALYGFDIALAPGVLVLADDHGVSILPQVERHLAFFGVHGQILFCREIDVRIRTCSPYYLKPARRSHRSPPYLPRSPKLPRQSRDSLLFPL